MAAAAVACVLVAAGCNPLLGDPVSQGGELEITTARLVGSEPVWIELAVSGAGDVGVYALGLIDVADLHGPTQRSCASSSGWVPCSVTATGVQMPDQRLVPGADASTYVRLMTVWPGETISVVLVCVDAVDAVGDLGCPGTTRTALAAVDEDGTRTGDLVPR
ncbi:MAG: hypothetical protein ACXWBN_03255 [Acidimicrobiales bacterium]